MLTTDARQTANQANAQHSTGPKTPDGKAAVAQNAISLGLFSSRDLVRPEEQSEYDELRASLESHLRPATAMERTHAMEILHAAWRLRRCALVEANLLAPTLESGLDPMEQDKTAATTQVKVDRARAQARNSANSAPNLTPTPNRNPKVSSAATTCRGPSPAKPAASSSSANSPEPTASNRSFGAPWLPEKRRGPMKIHPLLQNKPILRVGRRPEGLTLRHQKKGHKQTRGEETGGGRYASGDAADET
jgi:hypothetical protein